MMKANTQIGKTKYSKPAIVISSSLLALAIAGCGSAGTVDSAHLSSDTHTSVSPQPVSQHIAKPKLSSFHLTSALATSVGQDSKLSITFNKNVSTHSLSLSPGTQGKWIVQGKQLVFTPKYPLLPSTQYSVNISTLKSSTGQGLNRRRTVDYNTGQSSTLLVQKYLARLDYLPVSYSSKTEKFHWRFPHTPAALKASWSVGQLTSATKGAIMSFESVHGLTPDGVAGPQVWKVLLRATQAQQKDPHPYDYLMAVTGSPELLKVWREGKIIFTTPMNSGVPGATTQSGTFPVFSKSVVTTMRGTDVDGSSYDVIVHWVS
jgi:hypothetical protein